MTIEGEVKIGVPKVTSGRQIRTFRGRPSCWNESSGNYHDNVDARLISPMFGAALRKRIQHWVLLALVRFYIER